MKKIILASFAIFILLGLSFGAYFYFNQEESPYYFIAIHHEPHNDINPNKELLFSQEYNLTKSMVEKADEYNIKLTLMFSAPWAEYISKDSERLAELNSWRENGHEISGHHHSYYHGNWDGYSPYSQEFSELQRTKLGKSPETYFGDLDDLITELKKINPLIKSGCFNEEEDKNVLPDEIIYSTCSGFAKEGEFIERASDFKDADKGINEVILTGIVNGIKRKWLTHFQITTPENLDIAKENFNNMDDSFVYGAVIHNSKFEVINYYEFLELLHSKDPKGLKSKTLTQIIESKLLPEKEISSEKLTKKENIRINSGYEPRINNLCGDGVCDNIETQNTQLCPEDCD